MSNYSDRVDAFNAASGSHYSASANFLTFRSTRRGILVGWTLAKPDEINELCRAVKSAGKPYYAKVNGRIIERGEQED